MDLQDAGFRSFSVPNGTAIRIPGASGALIELYIEDSSQLALIDAAAVAYYLPKENLVVAAAPAILRNDATTPIVVFWRYGAGH